MKLSIPFLSVFSSVAIAAVLFAGCEPKTGEPSGAKPTTEAPSASEAKFEPSMDFAASKALAAKEGKPLLLEFTGSDWCPPCKMMKAETLSKEAFQKFAAANLIFVELDFPRSRELPAGVPEQNQTLQGEYNVEGYPTFILLDSQGKELARHVGFLPGGPSAFINWVNQSLPQG